jgi:hypothetical protein
MVLVYMDAYTGNPGILVGSGTYFPANISGSIYQYIPSPSVNQIPLAGVLLNTGTTTITWSNIYDVRQWVHATPSGTSSGGGGSGIDTIGFVGQNNGAYLATGTVLNVNGTRISMSVSGTVFNLTNSPDPYDNIGIYGMSGTTGIGTGTTLVVRNYLGLSSTGTFLYLNPSIGTGTFQLASGDRGVTNGDTHDHVGGDGAAIVGIVTPETNTNDVFRVNSASDSDFVSTITSTSGSSLVYGVVSAGAENAINVLASTQLAKIRLYNTSNAPVDYLLISSVNTSTNTITFTDTVPAGWAIGETITCRSQTNTDVLGTAYFMDLEITSGPTGAAGLMLFIGYVDVAGEVFSLHPFEAFGAGKNQYITLIGTTQQNASYLVKVTTNVFTIRWSASGAATATIILREAGKVG